MSAIRIIGIGSPFGDDRIGWAAIDAIDHSGMLGDFPAGVVETFRCSQPATDLLPLLAGAGAALLIDATYGDAVAGTVRKIDVGELRAEPGNISSHGLGVAESLALGRSLGMLPAALTIYGVEIRRVGMAPGMSAEVLAAIPVLLGAIMAELRALLHGTLHEGGCSITPSPSTG